MDYTCILYILGNRTINVVHIIFSLTDIDIITAIYVLVIYLSMQLYHPSSGIYNMVTSVNNHLS